MYGQNQTHLSAGRAYQRNLFKLTQVTLAFQRPTGYLFFSCRLQILKGRYTMTEARNFYSSYINLCVLNGFLCCIAISLNGITIHAIRKTSSLPNTLRILLLSLAVSDLGVGLLVQPLNIAFFVMEMGPNAESNPTYKITSSVQRVVVNLFYYATFFDILALSVDRFLAIYLHLRYQELVTHKRVVAVVISIWISSSFISSVHFWIATNIIRDAIYLTIEVACLLTTTLLYCKIYLAVKRHKRQLRALHIQQQAQNESVGHRGRFKTAIGAFYIYLVFLACYLPHNCSYVSRVLTGSYNLDGLVRHLVRYTLTLTWLNSSLNPLIYSWKMKQIRLTIKNIFQNMLPIT